jgi:hypothetical protein
MCNIGINKNLSRGNEIIPKGNPGENKTQTQPETYSDTVKTILKDGLEVSTQTTGKVPALIKIPNLAGEGSNIHNPEQYQQTPSFTETDEEKLVVPPKHIPYLAGEGISSDNDGEEENPVIDESGNNEKFIPYIAGEGSSKPH